MVCWRSLPRTEHHVGARTLRENRVCMAQGVSILACMDEIPLEGAIIRPYVDLNLETLHNVRTAVRALSFPGHRCTRWHPPALDCSGRRRILSDRIAGCCS